MSTLRMVSSAAVARLLRDELARNPFGGIQAIALRCEAAGFSTRGSWETWVSQVLRSNPEVGKRPANARLEVEEHKVDKLFQAMDWTHYWRTEPGLTPRKRKMRRDVAA